MSAPNAQSTAVRLSLWERRLDAVMPADDGPSRTLLAHARVEWAHGNYAQVLADLDRLAEQWPQPYPCEWASIR